MPLTDSFGPFVGLDPGAVGLEDCESLFTHLKTKKRVAEKFLVRHFFSIQHALGAGELEDVFWLPGTEYPADGLSKVRGDMVLLARLLESGCFNPGNLRPLKGLAWKE